MTSPNARPAPEPQGVRPYAMTGGRTRPTHDDLEIETLVSTNSTGEQAPKLTVEQRGHRRPVPRHSWRPAISIGDRPRIRSSPTTGIVGRAGRIRAVQGSASC